jgi:hypothetical protein
MSANHDVSQPKQPTEFGVFVPAPRHVETYARK